MPKIGMEPIRRKALIEATILEIGNAGSLNVTVGKIAKRAGVSSALAHHYFGSKDQILLAAMREILARFGQNVNRELAGANTPLQRVEAIIDASFHVDNFQPQVVASWLTFYVLAQNSADAQRLLQVYAQRLQSNLVYDLCKLTDRDKAKRIANGLASIIDGFYIRQALQKSTADRVETISIVKQYLALQLQADARTPS
ncbi:MAG: transcriptional regulator BetI [Amylibacter sp.]|nr:transcriptional regulator BetI [Amylibacter sp.]